MHHSFRSSTKSAAALVAYAVLGWAYCGALVGLGRQFFSMQTTLVIHAIGAPAGFAAISWLYHRAFPFARPLVTAFACLGIVVALDLLVVAVFIERSFAMFHSILGTWLPFLLIFAVTYVVGLLAARG